jgi:hypothetical protein
MTAEGTVGAPTCFARKYFTVSKGVHFRTCFTVNFCFQKHKEQQLQQQQQQEGGGGGGGGGGGQQSNGQVSEL